MVGGRVEAAPPDSEAVVGDSTTVLCEEALLHGDTLVCSPSSSPARAFSALERGVTRMKPTPTKQ